MHTWRILHVPTQTHTCCKMPYLDIVIFRSSACPKPHRQQPASSPTYHCQVFITKLNPCAPLTYHFCNKCQQHSCWMCSLAAWSLWQDKGGWFLMKADFNPIFLITASTLLPTSPDSLCKGRHFSGGQLKLSRALECQNRKMTKLMEIRARLQDDPPQKRFPKALQHIWH